LADYITNYKDDLRNKKSGIRHLEKDKSTLNELQQLLYATNNHSVLLIFQAMDAAGKDSTISHVFSGMFPQGGNVTSFKVPSALELDHDYLWRTQLCLPERGRLSIFNHSYYEEVLVTKVHPQLILNQRIPSIKDISQIDDAFWNQRYESIRNHEKHLTQNGTIILKFFLNVSKEEQKKRFLDRIDKPEKNWKFNMADLNERALWEAYQNAYEKAIVETARPTAPWFVIPADRKWFMRAAVCKIIVEKLKELNLTYPKLEPVELAELQLAKELLNTDE
jgi:PPK2 family polyphosphate:nucleotide phosphotransferase